MNFIVDRIVLAYFIYNYYLQALEYSSMIRVRKSFPLFGILTSTNLAPFSSESPELASVDLGSSET